MQSEVDACEYLMILYFQFISEEDMRTVDLFCGCGGLSLGFQNSGYEIVGAFDSWQEAVNCYNANFDHEAHILDLSHKNIALREIRPLNPEIIIGGPPCQEFSSAGSRKEGKKANLTVSFAKIVKSIKPKYFVMENVSRAKQSKAYAEARELFHAAGYGLTEQILDASKCGVPQRRKRLFCIGALNQPDGFLNVYLSANQSILPLTMRQYFEANNYEITFEHYYRHPRSYARRAIFSIDEPAATIRGVNRPKPPEYIMHPNDSAPPEGVNSLTARQRALLQTFPADFTFHNNQNVAEQLIGNAVPVNLAAHVARAILAFDNNDFSSRSIMYTAWLQEIHRLTPLAAKDNISRLGRCNRLVHLSDVSRQQYIQSLEQTDDFQKLSKSVKSQLRRAVTLYYEYIERPHQN